MAAGADPEVPVTLCEKNLYLFNQYTGQCWSDATMVFLLFSEGLGPATQKKILMPKADLERAFYDFATKEKDVIQNIAGYPLDDVTFEEFIVNTTVYINCIKRRFENWRLRTKNIRESVRPALQRCDSMLYSLCQETAAPEANELLYPASPSTAANFEGKSEAEKLQVRQAELLGIYRRSVTRKNAAQPLLEKVEALRGKEGTTVESLVKENVKFSNVRGYSPKRLGKLVSVLIYFFLDGATGVAGYTPSKQTVNVKTQVDDSIKSSALYQDEITIGIDIDPFAPEIEAKEIVQNMMPAMTVSTVLLVHDVKFDGTNHSIDGHAIALLECGGSQYLYDDNLKILVQINWKDVFSEPYSAVYYMIMKNGHVRLIRYLKEEADEENPNSVEKHTVIIYSLGSDPKEQALEEVFGGSDLWSRLQKLEPAALYAVKDFGFFFVINRSPPAEAKTEEAKGGTRRVRRRGRAQTRVRRGLRQGPRQGLRRPRKA
jgi:hypothetical protein